MNLNVDGISFKYTNNTKELIEQLSQNNDPKFSVEIHQDVTLKNPPSYKELYEMMEDYKHKLIEIRDYEPYSLNNYTEFINSRTNGIE